jgi:hypothetical protein
MTRAEIAADFRDWVSARWVLASGQALCRSYPLGEPVVGWEQSEWRPYLELLGDAGYEWSVVLADGRLTFFVGMADVAADVAADAPALVEARDD